MRSADDGEPGGTAGRPILAAIDGEGLDRVCVLVTRCEDAAARELVCLDLQGNFSSHACICCLSCQHGV